MNKIILYKLVKNFFIVLFTLIFYNFLKYKWDLIPQWEAPHTYRDSVTTYAYLVK